MSTIAYLIVGSIGSGKSTVSSFLLTNSQLEGVEYIGSDIYKQQFFNIDVSIDSRGYRCADELAFARMQELSLNKKNFVFELCPTNLNKIRALNSICVRANYDVVSFFIGTNNVNINITRCKERENIGSDKVNETKVKKRYYESMKNILLLIRMSRTIYFIDNSEAFPSMVAYIKNNQVYTWDNSKCAWFNNYVSNKLLKT